MTTSQSQAPKAQPRNNTSNRKVGIARSLARVPLMPFQWAVGYSTGLHIVTPFAVALLFFLLSALLMWLMHFDLMKWLNPPKKPDMVFVLVNDRNAKAPDQAKFRGEFNQRAGGQRKPDEEIRPPEKISNPSPDAQQQAKPESKPTPPKPAMKPQPQQQPVTQQTQPKPQPQQPAPKKAEKAPPMPKPTFKPTIPMPMKAQAQMPKPQAQQSPTGPVAQARQASKSSPSSNPSPVQIASRPEVAMSSQRAMGNSTSGSPQGGAGDDGVDVMADQDLGPVISEVTKRIKRNWTPPRAAQTRRIVVRFILARDGRVLDRRVTQSSGDPLSDDSAIRAIDVSAPFRPFPPSVKLEKVPIDFTFDYNVLMNRQKSASQ